MASFFVGVISKEKITVAPGVALEEPLLAKKRRLCPTEEPLAGALKVSTSTPTSIRGATIESTPSTSRGLKGPAKQSKARKTLKNKVSDPTLESIESTPSTSKGPANQTKARKTLENNVSDPRLEELENVGSDSDSDDEDGDNYLFDVPTRQITDMLDWAEDFVEAHGVAGGQSSEPSAPAMTPSSATSKPVSESTYGPNMSDFFWETLPQPPVDPASRREPFTATTGPVGSYSDPYEIFVKYWDCSIMQMIAEETNRYAEQCILKKMNLGTLEGSSRLLMWKDTNVDELYVFFAIILATGVVIKSDTTEYWSVNNDIFDTPNFGSHMSYNRFIAIASMLHFVNNEEIDISLHSKTEAKILKLAPIVRHLNTKFQSLYQLGQCIALDESLTQWKGWLGNQFIRNKAATSVKTYEVCDSGSGYLWRFKFHAGREDGDEENGYNTPLVLKLLEGLENKGHTVFMDNHYNSPMLARLLKSKGFDCVGTIRLNTQYVPTQLKSLVNTTLSAGSVYGCTSGDVDVLVWKNRNLVPLISTYHGASSVSRAERTKPAVVHDYSVRMRVVYRKDQMLSNYPLEHKRTTAWYKKLFRRLLNVSILNAYIVYRDSTPRVTRGSHPPKYTHRQFRKALVKSILARHSEQSTTLYPKVESNKIFFSNVILKHIPEEYPYLENSKVKQRGRCAVCRKRITMRCPGCNVALCLKECFAKYHTPD